MRIYVIAVGVDVDVDVYNCSKQTNRVALLLEEPAGNENTSSFKPAARSADTDSKSEAAAAEVGFRFQP